MRRLAIFLDLIFLAQVSFAQGIITTVVGGGPNNVSATSANLHNPFAIAFDGSGNLYIAADSAHRVFKVDPAGQLTLLAGNGVPGFSGDGGPATAASLNRPIGLAVDSAGNVFIMEFNNNRIRRVNAATGAISTVAGSGFFGFCNNGLATNATFSNAIGIAFDSIGNLYVADQGNSCVRRIIPGADGIITGAADETITTVAGNGSASFAGDGGLATNASLRFPSGVALDSAGNLFIVDRGNNRIRRVSASTGIITTLAGNGNFGFNGDGIPATAASFASPVGLALDAAGNLFIAEQSGQRIRRVAASTGIISTVAGNGIGGFAGDGGPATAGNLSSAPAVALSLAGDIFVADMGNSRIRRVSAGADGFVTGAGDELITTFAGNGSTGYGGDGSLASGASLSTPTDVTTDSFGNWYVSDLGNARIRKVDRATGIVSTVAGNGLFTFSGDGGPATAASFSQVWQIASDAAGNLYLADFVNNRIRRVDAASGIISTIAGNGLLGFSGDGGPATAASLFRPFGVAVNAAGAILIIGDDLNHRVRKVDLSTGIITTVAGNGVAGFSGDGGPALSAALNDVKGVALDTSGNIYVADFGNRRVRRVDAMTGIITTVAGNGVFGFSGDGGPATNARLSQPVSLKVDGSGNVWIADFSNQRIRRVDGATGVITTVAGNGVFGFSGDGGPATAAALAFPEGLAIDGGTLLIADRNNQRIRRVAIDATAPSIIPTVTGGLGNEGWYTSDVSVSWAVSDAESAITATAGCAATNITADTAGVTITCTATSTGGTASQSVTIKRDATAPEIQFVTRTAPNGAGWNNSDVTAEWTCSDATSGANAANVSESLATEGAGLDITGTCNDAAGNSASDTQSDINIDKTAPTASATAFPAANANGWNNGDVTVNFTGADALSGIESCSAPGLLSEEGAGQSVPGTCTDVAGNSSAVATAGDIHIDKTAPGVTGTASRAADANGWYNHALTVGWSGSDALSGVASCSAAASYAGPDSAAASVNGSCNDLAGNAGNGGFAFQYDATAPVINITAPAQDAVYLLHASVPAAYGCSDNLSGVGACAGPVASGANLNTASVGAKSFTVNASDAAGNPATLTRGYRVHYNFVGFFEPVNNLPVINVANGGRTIPLKWRVQTASGAQVTDVASFVSLMSAPMACDASPTDVVETELTTIGDTVPRWDGAQWHFNWKTVKGWRGCRLLQLTLADGTMQYAKFNFK